MNVDKLLSDYRNVKWQCAMFTSGTPHCMEVNKGLSFTKIKILIPLLHMHAIKKAQPFLLEHLERQDD